MLLLNIITTVVLLVVPLSHVIASPPSLIGRTAQGRACRVVYNDSRPGIMGINLLLYSSRAKWEAIATFLVNPVAPQVNVFEAACRVLPHRYFGITSELRDGQWMQVAKLRCESEDGERFFEAEFEYQQDILRPIRIHRRSNVDEPSSVTCDFTPFWRALRHFH